MVASLVSNGSKSCSISGLSYSTTYYWFVNATDGSSWTNETYYFLTEEAESVWSDCIQLTINHNYIDTDLINFPLLVVINSTIGTDCNIGSSIRFNNSDNTTEFDYEIESWNSSGDSYVWVNVTRVSSSVDTVIWMRYNNSGVSDNQNPSGVWDSYYGGVWHLNETAAVDSTGNGNTGTPGGSPAVVSGKVGGAVDFGSASDVYEIELGTDSSIDLSNHDQFTIEFWAYFDSDVADQMCFVQSQDIDSWNIGFGTYDADISNAHFKFLHRDDDSSGRDTIESGADVSTGSWHYYVGTYNNGADDNKSLYIDGDFCVSTTNGVNNLRNGPASSTVLGYGGDFGPMDGRIDECRVSPLVRNASWIKANFHTQNQTPGFLRWSAVVNNAPIFSGGVPGNGSTGISIGTSSLTITIEDPDGDSFDWAIETCPDIGSCSATGASNGSKSCSISDLSYSTTYHWFVNVTDGEHWTNETYFFITEYGAGDWWNYEWPYRKEITIDHSMVEDDLTNFPVLIDFVDVDLAAKAQTDGDDILFTDFSLNKLDHEIELFDSGHLVAWVAVPSLSSAIDTVLYMYYGNLICDSQENVEGVWDSGFEAVWHLDETSGGVDAWKDSTGNGYHGTDENMNQGDLGTDFDASGRIDGAVQFDGSDDGIDTGLYPYDGKRTLEFWVNLDTVTGDSTIGCHDQSNHRFYAGFRNSNAFFGVGNSASVNVPLSLSTGNWYYIVVTADGSTARYYLNAVELDSFSYSQSGGSARSFTSAFTNGNTYGFLDGVIDEVRVSYTDRSIGWISTCFNNQYEHDSFYEVGGEVAY